VDDARRLVELANEDPVAARPLATDMIAAASAAGDDRVAAIAGRAAGLAEAHVGDLRRSTELLRDAVAAASSSGDTELQGEVEMTAGAVMAWAGDTAGGLAALERSIAMLGGVKRARALVQRGTVRYRTAEFEAAIGDFDAAEPTLRRHDDQLWLANLLSNRGLSLAYRGSLPDAAAALEQARSVYAELGLRFAETQMVHNLGWVAARLGDVPGALEWFDQAEARYAALDNHPPELFRDRAAALISVHLADEAYEEAVRAAEALKRDGHAAGHAEALGRAAEAAFLAERFDDAVAFAEEAEEAFTDQQRTTWAQYAALTSLRAMGRTAAASPDLWQRACDIAADLEEAGLASGAMAARVLAADLALNAGDPDAARVELTRAADARATAPIDLRAEAWFVTARLRRLDGDDRGAVRAVDAGLRVVERFQAIQGATETRAHAAGHAQRLAALGVELAWESQRPRRLLRWLERTRAGALRYPPVRVPDDRGLAAQLAELRRIEAARLDSDAVDQGQQLERQRRRAEAEIKRQTRKSAGAVSPPWSLDVDALLEALGDRMLVEYGRVGSSLVAVTVADGRVRRHDGPAVRSIVDAMDLLRFGTSRLAQRRGSDASRAAALEGACEAAATLSRLLLEPLPIGDRELVVVPPAALHALAWSLLPAAMGRPLSVSPSAALWLNRHDGETTARPLLFAGPRLPEAPAEIEAIGAVYPRSTAFEATDGTVATLAEALPEARLAHLACHGRFRADNPLFSALEFGDGWFTVYDFENLAAVPEVMVLSACDAGLSAERPGDEVMGIVAGLLGSGVQTVVASVGLVPDAVSTRTVMVDFHRRLAAGDRVGTALAAAQQRAASAGDLASAQFTCFGRG
jgi:tetratricopeptide (TPR) repeat protein